MGTGIRPHFRSKKNTNMEWLEFILSALGGSVVGGVGSILYFRPKLKEAKAEASKAETEASSAEYAHLLERINTMEEMYKRQGETIDSLRKELLDLGQAKYESDKKVLQLEAENRTLRERVDKLSEAVNAYKTINGQK